MPRVVAGAEARQLDDLRWLGLDWDEGPDVGGPARTVPAVRAHGALRGRARRPSRSRDLALLLRLLARRDRPRRERAASRRRGPALPGNLPRPRACDRGRGSARPPSGSGCPTGDVAIEDALQGRVVQDVAADGRRLRAPPGRRRVRLPARRRGRRPRDGRHRGGARRRPARVDAAAGAAGRRSSAARRRAGRTSRWCSQPDGSRLAKRDAGITLREHRDGRRRTPAR